MKIITHGKNKVNPKPKDQVLFTCPNCFCRFVSESPEDYDYSFDIYSDKSFLGLDCLMVKFVCKAKCPDCGEEVITVQEKPLGENELKEGLEND